MRDATQEELLAIFADLEAMHAWRGWHWWPDPDPFEVTVGCILVQNTQWTNVERALERLKGASALDPGAMAALSDAELEELIRPSGQYRQKAKKLRTFLALCERRGGFSALLGLPAAELRSELLATWGIGPESADAIVLYAAQKEAFVIDAYTVRIMSRLGIGPESQDYHEWQRWFIARMPADRDLWARSHALVVMHAKHLCRKARPACSVCALAQRCEFARGAAAS